HVGITTDTARRVGPAGMSSATVTGARAAHARQADAVRLESREHFGHLGGREDRRLADRQRTQVRRAEALDLDREPQRLRERGAERDLPVVREEAGAATLH